jgi:hypothetical protein
MAIFMSFKVAAIAIAQELQSFDLRGVKSVNVKNGNLFILDNNNSFRQITFAGIDSAPHLSSDKKEVVFLRDYGDVIDDSKLNQIWIVNLGSLKEECILKAGKISSKHATIPKSYTDAFGSKLDQIDKVIFSNNSNTIYFLSNAWVTSGAIFSFDRKKSKLTFLTSGNSLDIISKGNFKYDLIVNKHKYNPQGGSYDFYYIINPNNGKELKTIGDINIYIDKEH